MTELTAAEVVMVLNRLSIEIDNTMYCLDKGVPGVDILREAEGDPILPLINVCVTDEKRPDLYQVAERLTLDEAVKRISVLLSIGVEEGDCAG